MGGYRRRFCGRERYRLPARATAAGTKPTKSTKITKPTMVFFADFVAFVILWPLPSAVFPHAKVAAVCIKRSFG